MQLDLCARVSVCACVRVRACVCVRACVSHKLHQRCVELYLPQGWCNFSPGLIRNLDKHSFFSYLDRQRFIQELLEEIFFGGLTQDDGFATVVKQWSVGTTSHLKYISDRVIHVPGIQSPYRAKKPAERFGCYSYCLQARPGHHENLDGVIGQVQ